MTPPINIDGSTVDAITIDGTEVTEVTAEGEVVFGSAIPDSVVSRPEDNASSSRTADEGLHIETQSDWPSIGARLSKNTDSTPTKAYLKDNSDSVIQSVDISGLSGGDAFTFDDVNLQSNTKYIITIDAEGSQYTVGVENNTAGSYPYTSTDLDIIGNYERGTTGTGGARGLNDIGKTGF